MTIKRSNTIKKYIRKQKNLSSQEFIQPADKPYMPKFINRYTVSVALLFIVHAFFSFYNLEKWANFDWDQVDNAWASVRILLAHKYPLIGTVAKQNSNMYIGPLYYYLTALIYHLTHLNPIASPILASCSRIVSFFILIVFSERLFNRKVSLVSGCLYVFSSYIIHAERSQWTVNFFAPVSLMILYYLSEVVKGHSKYFIHLAVMTGIAFHLHFSAVFFPVIFLAALPLIPFSSIRWKYPFAGAAAGLLFFIPQTIYILAQPAHAQAYSSYFRTYYHGFHFRRFVQVSHDAFIKFQSILELAFPRLRDRVILFIPAFYAALITVKAKDKPWKLLYLVSLWFVVPWVLFTAYSGEISDYYFSINLYVTVIILSVISVRIWDTRQLVARLGITAVILYYAFINTQAFMNTDTGSLYTNTKEVLSDVEKGKAIGFTQGDPKSYLYFYYIYSRTGQQPYKL